MFDAIAAFPLAQWHPQGRPPYSVGHVTELHRLPDSPALRQAPEAQTRDYR